MSLLLLPRALRDIDDALERSASAGGAGAAIVLARRVDRAISLIEA